MRKIFDKWIGGLVWDTSWVERLVNAVGRLVG